MSSTTAALNRRGKAVFIDGPSMNAIKGALGFGALDLPGLYTVLTKQIGSVTALVAPPVITANPRRIHDLDGFRKAIAQAGFDLIESDTAHGADDKALIDRITRLSPNLVEEIVMVTSDADFIPSLRVKVSQGIQVFWASTFRLRSGEHRHGLSSRLINLFDAGEFTFVELNRFRRCIGRTDRNGQGSARDLPDLKGKIVIRLTLDGQHSPRMKCDLIDELTRLRKRFPGIQCTVE